MGGGKAYLVLWWRLWWYLCSLARHGLPGAGCRAGGREDDKRLAIRRGLVMVVYLSKNCLWFIVFCFFKQLSMAVFFGLPWLNLWLNYLVLFTIIYLEV